MTDLSTQREVDCPEPDDHSELVDRTGPARAAGPWPVDPPSVFSAGVPLRRLLARAQLSVPQAIELACGVTAEAARRAEGGGQGAVLIGADGRVVAGPAAGGAADGAGAVAAVLAGIADSVRPQASAAGPAAEQLLTELDGAVADLPVTGVPAAARRLRDATGALDRSRVRAQLGALVRAVGADPAPAVDGTRAVDGAPAADGARAADGAPSAGGAPARAWAPPGRARSVRRRAGAWLLSLLVLGGVVLLEVGFLRDHIAADVALLLDAGRGGGSSSSSAAPTQDGVAVARPAPASAGPVAGVDLRALAPCAPGTACTVRLAVALEPGAQKQVVAWSYRVVDRCTGTARAIPGGSLALPAGGRQAAAVAAVPLPVGRGLALMAVTRQPAVAASAPVVIGSCAPSPSAHVPQPSAHASHVSAHPSARPSPQR